MAELTPDQQATLAALRAALPPIVTEHYAGIAALVAMWTNGELVCIDCEWNPDTGRLETVGVGNERIVVQLAWTENDYTNHEIQFDVAQLIRETPVVYQNAASDIKKLREHGFKISVADHFEINDTMLVHAVLHSEEDHDLGYLNATYKTGLPDYKPLRKVAPSEYNAADLVATCLIWKNGIRPELLRDPAAEAVYRDQSLAFLAEIQIETEEAGIRVDKSKPYPLYDKYDLKRKQATMLAQAYAGWPINLGSPADMKLMLYEVEQMPVQRTKGPVQSAKPTSDKDAIAALRRRLGMEWDADEEPTLEQAWANIDAGGNPVLEARYLFMGAQQALSHYVSPCLEFGPKGEISGVRDRIYPEIRQHTQASGRHSFVGPAVQQYKGELLDLITPDPGTCWVGHDWSQIEVRLLAYLANDTPYLEAFARGDDVHEINARAIFGPAGTPELEALRRRFIKAFAFRLHYRGHPKNAGDIPGTKALGLNVERLIAASDVYMAGHPAIVEYWNRLEEQADRHRVVYTFMGRPRRLTSPYRAARNREASNQPMQGGVADIYVTTALLVKRAAPWARFVYGAHDSQFWSVPVERRDEFMALYAPIVQRTFTINGRDAVFPAEFKERSAA